MSIWDDDFDAPRPGPRVVCCTSFSHLGDLVRGDERLASHALERTPPRLESGEVKRRQREREATAALVGLLS